MQAYHQESYEEFVGFTEEIFDQEYDFAFITAMDEEIQNLLLQDPEFEQKKIDIEQLIDKAYRVGNARFIPFKLRTECRDKIINLKAIACITGIGKANAAAGTAILLSKAKVEILINYGFCGAVDPNAPVGTVYIGESTSYGDVDVTGFGYQYGQIPNSPVSFCSPPKFTETIYNDNRDHLVYLDMGRIVTTDMFIASRALKSEIINRVQVAKEAEGNNFPILGFDMESAAIAQIARAFDKKVYIFKEVSDSGDEAATESFDKTAYDNTVTALNNTIALIIGTLPRFAMGIAVKSCKKY